MEFKAGIAMMTKLQSGAVKHGMESVAHAQTSVKTSLSATVNGGFGLDATLFMRLVAAMSLMARPCPKDLANTSRARFPAQISFQVQRRYAPELRWKRTMIGSTF